MLSQHRATIEENDRITAKVIDEDTVFLMVGDSLDVTIPAARIRELIDKLEVAESAIHHQGLRKIEDIRLRRHVTINVQGGVLSEDITRQVAEAMLQRGKGL